MQGTVGNCLRCRTVHEDDFRACPAVKAIEISITGQITRVEFMTPMDFPQVKQEEPEQPYEKLPGVA